MFIEFELILKQRESDIIILFFDSVSLPINHGLCEFKFSIRFEIQLLDIQFNNQFDYMNSESTNSIFMFLIDARYIHF